MNNRILNKKVSIIGSGFVGSTIAYSLMMKNLANEIVLIDLNEQLSRAETLDIRHGIPYMGVSNIHSGVYSDIKDSDLIIITAGRNRKPNETRLQMAADNVLILKKVCDEINKYYNTGVILVVTNPIDVAVKKVSEWVSLPRGMVFGTGCILDSSRLTNAVADYLELSPEVVNAQVVGEHGSSQVTVWSKLTIAGMPISDYCKTVGKPFDRSIKTKLSRAVVDMGTTIIKGKGKTHYGIATCVCYIADAILNRRATIITVSIPLIGEYGLKDVSVSVPCVVSTNGVTMIIEDSFSKNEMMLLKESADKVKGVLANL